MSIDRRLERVEQARAARKRPSSALTDAQAVAARQARWAEYLREKADYEALSVAEKIAHKRQELAETIAAWEGRDRTAFCVNTDEMHRLRCRLIAIDIMELENPSMDIEALRRQANEGFRHRGKVQPEPAIIERSSVVATVEAPTAKPDVRAPTELRPKFDKLEEYRGEARVQIWEPSHT